MLRGSCAYNQIADEDLQNLRLQAGPPRKYFLQDANQDMSQRRANESTVHGHLRHSRIDVVPVFATVMRNPGGKNLLQSR